MADPKDIDSVHRCDFIGVLHTGRRFDLCDQMRFVDTRRRRDARSWGCAPSFARAPSQYHPNATRHVRWGSAALRIGSTRRLTAIRQWGWCWRPTRCMDKTIRPPARRWTRRSENPKCRPSGDRKEVIACPILSARKRRCATWLPLPRPVSACNCRRRFMARPALLRPEGHRPDRATSRLELSDCLRHDVPRRTTIIPLGDFGLTGVARNSSRPGDPGGISEVPARFARKLKFSGVGRMLATRPGRCPCLSCRGRCRAQG
jgi:hypothetical protein